MQKDKAYLFKIASEYGMDTYEFSKKISKNIIEKVPSDMAWRYRLIPVNFKDGVLTVAMSDPSDLEALDSLRYILRLDVEGVVADEKQVEEALEMYYGKNRSKKFSKSVAEALGEV